MVGGMVGYHLHRLGLGGTFISVEREELTELRVYHSIFMCYHYHYHYYLYYQNRICEINRDCGPDLAFLTMVWYGMTRTSLENLRGRLDCGQFKHIR